MEFIACISLLAIPWPLRALIRPSLEDEFAMMTAEQRQVLRWAYDKGKPHGFGETMRAMVWQESSAGKRLRNPKDKRGGSYGRFGTTLVSARNRSYLFREAGLRPSTDEEMIECLVMFHYIAAKHCLAELKFWDRIRGENWMDIWASYNDGWTITGQGPRYADQIRAKVRLLRREMGL